MERQLVDLRSHKQGHMGQPCPLAWPSPPQDLGVPLEARLQLLSPALVAGGGGLAKNQARATQTEFLGWQGRDSNG